MLRVERHERQSSVRGQAHAPAGVGREVRQEALVLFLYARCPACVCYTCSVFRGSVRVRIRVYPTVSRIRAARCRSRVCIVPAADSGRNLPALSCRTEFLRAGGRKEVVLHQQRPVVFCHNMIAHRLKTVRHAAQILVVDKGQIFQRGTHEALMAQGSIYRRFITGREQAVGWKL